MDKKKGWEMKLLYFKKGWEKFKELLKDKSGEFSLGGVKEQPITERYFMLPNQVFQIDLSGGEILVYAYLMYCEDRKTYKCHPSYRTIGAATHMSKNTVKKYVEGLVKKKLITTEPTVITTKSGQKHNGSLEYTVLPISCAVEYYERENMKKLQQEQWIANAQRVIEEYHRKKAI